MTQHVKRVLTKTTPVSTPHVPHSWPGTCAPSVGFSPAYKPQQKITKEKETLTSV